MPLDEIWRALKVIVNPTLSDEVDFNRPDEKDLAIADANQEMWRESAAAVDASRRMKSNLEIMVQEMRESR